MKKRVIYSEFQRIAGEIVGENRKAQKYYVMQMCEQLGKVDYKKMFVMWCSKKRCVAYQKDVETENPQNGKDGNYYLFHAKGIAAYKVRI